MRAPRKYAFTKAGIGPARSVEIQWQIWLGAETRPRYDVYADDIPTALAQLGVDDLAQVTAVYPAPGHGDVHDKLAADAFNRGVK